MPLYMVGAFRAFCLALITFLLAFPVDLPGAWAAAGFLALGPSTRSSAGWSPFPRNDIVGRSIPSHARPYARASLLWRRCAGARCRPDHPVTARDDRFPDRARSN